MITNELSFYLLQIYSITNYKLRITNQIFPNHSSTNPTQLNLHHQSQHRPPKKNQK